MIDLRITELLTWALNGTAPRVVSRLRPVRRRGPTPPAPALDNTSHQRLVANLLDLSHSSADGGPSNLLLRRQACFLAGLAGLDVTTSLTRIAARYFAGDHEWTPAWADARSFAVARAYRNDPQPLRDFITHAHHSSDCDTAALNYTAYWVGDLPHREGSDAFMVRDKLTWQGHHMYHHLVDRLQSHHPLIDLNVHNLWLLLRAKPAIISHEPATTMWLRERIAILADSAQTSPQSKRELLSITRTLTHLTNPKGSPR